MLNPVKIRITKAIIAISFMLTVVTSSFAASAATYTTYATRGVKFLCWSKDSVTWSTNSSKITSVDTNQSRSGVLIENKGIKKENARSSSTKHSYLCKHTLLAGPKVGGITIGWAEDCNNRVYIYRSGSTIWYQDV